MQFSIYGNYFLTLTLYCHLLSCKGLLSCNVVTSNKALDTCVCTVSVPQLYSLSHCYQKQHAHTNSLFSPDSHLALGGSTSLAQSVFPQHCTWHNVQMRVSLGWHTALPRQSDTALASVPLVNSQANCIQTEQTFFFFFFPMDEWCTSPGNGHICSPGVASGACCTCFHQKERWCNCFTGSEQLCQFYSSGLILLQVWYQDLAHTGQDGAGSATQQVCFRGKASQTMCGLSPNPASVALILFQNSG